MEFWISELEIYLKFEFYGLEFLSNKEKISLEIIITLIVAIIIFGISFFLSMLGLGGAQLYVPIFYWLGMN
ncbi:MAG: hypothetical protein JSW07_12975 [bacterium]|nr:MAG: hypothetical protein JSW07_12975 [bacterium]